MWLPLPESNSKKQGGHISGIMGYSLQLINLYNVNNLEAIKQISGKGRPHDFKLFKTSLSLTYD